MRFPDLRFSFPVSSTSPAFGTSEPESSDTALKSTDGLMDFNKRISLKSGAPACQKSHFTAVIWSRCRQL